MKIWRFENLKMKKINQTYQIIHQKLDFMFKNYFKPAWRSLKKNKFFSSLNILGLAIGMASLWLIGTLLSGFYPAWVLSSFKPVIVLKGKLIGTGRGVLLRKALVVVQFTASVALIAGTFIVYSQLDYMMSRNPGMNINQMLVVERPGIADTNRKAYRADINLFRNELKNNPAIEAVTASLTVPGKQREYKLTVKNFGSNSYDSIIARANGVDYDFFNTFKMKLLAGKNFSKDDGSVILSEMAAHLLGFKNAKEAVGKTILLPRFHNSKHTVVGVVNDYHQLSFKKPLEPALFLCTPYEGEFYSMRIHTGHLSQTIHQVQQSWSKAFPGNPFEYFFLDDYFNKQYSNEQKFESCSSLFLYLLSLSVAWVYLVFHRLLHHKESKR